MVLSAAERPAAAIQLRAGSVLSSAPSSTARDQWQATLSSLLRNQPKVHFVLKVALTTNITGYHPTHALCDMPFVTCINFYVFRHGGAILRVSLRQRYVIQHASLHYARRYSNEQNLTILKHKIDNDKLQCYDIKY